MYPFVLAGHQKPITIVRFNFDGDLLFSGAAEKKINVWQAYTGERIGSYTTKSSVRSLDVDVDSKHLIVCSNDGSFEVFQVKTGQLLRSLKFQYKLRHVQFNCNSQKFLLVLDQFKNDTPSRVKVMDFAKILSLDRDYMRKEQSNTALNINQEHPQQETEKQIKIVTHSFPVMLNERIKTVTRALWYVEDRTIFVSTTEGDIIHYDMDGKVIGASVVHKEIKINSIAFSKDYSILATAADDGCKILDPETLSVLREFRQEFAMNAVAVSPLFCNVANPKFHIVMGGGVSAISAAMSGAAGFEAHVCNVMYAKEVGKISGHFGPINSIDFFKDGRGFVSGGEEGNIRVVRFTQAYFQDNNPQFQ